jgi:hypothetical protein
MNSLFQDDLIIFDNDEITIPTAPDFERGAKVNKDIKASHECNCPDRTKCNCGAKDMKAVIPKMPKNGAKNFNKLIFEANPCFLFVGKPKSGKSNGIKAVIMSQCLKKRSRYDFGLVFTGTKFNKDYDYIPKQYIIEGYDENVLQKFLDIIKERIEKEKKIPISFIIIDDMMGILNNYESLLTHVITCRRHYKIDIYLACQYVARCSSTTLRACVSYAVLFATRDRASLEALYKSFGGLFEKYNDFKNHFFKITDQKYKAMCYNNEQQHEAKDNYFPLKFPDMSKMKVKLEF